MTVQSHKNVQVHKGKSSVIAELPHGGTTIDQSYAPHFPHQDHDVHIGMVMGVDLLPNYLSLNPDHSIVRYLSPRVLADPNRGVKILQSFQDAVNLADGYVVQGGQGETDANGFIWRAVPLTKGAQPGRILKCPFNKNQFKKHVEKTGVLVYQHSVDSLLEEIRDEQGAAVAVGLHSIPPYQPKKVSKGEFKGAYVFRERISDCPDLILITNDGQSCAPEYIQCASDTAQKYGLHLIQGMGPLRGDFGSTVLYANPREGKHVIGLEIVSHGQLEPGRLEGTLTEPCQEELTPIQRFVEDFLNSADNITKNGRK